MRNQSIFDGCNFPALKAEVFTQAYRPDRTVQVEDGFTIASNHMNVGGSVIIRIDHDQKCAKPQNCRHEAMIAETQPLELQIGEAAFPARIAARRNLPRAHGGAERGGAIERGGFENERAEIRGAHLRGIAKCRVAQILSGAFEEPRRVGERSAARKNQRDVIFPNHHQAHRPMQVESGNAPRIHRLARCGKRFFHEAAQLIGHGLEFRVSLDASVENFSDVFGG